MPAQSGDLIGTAIERSLHAVKRTNSDCLDIKLVANAKRVLTSEIKYEKIFTNGNPSLIDLKTKYTILSPLDAGGTTTIAPIIDAQKQTPVQSTPRPSSQTNNKFTSIPAPKRILYPLEKVVLGWRESYPVGAGFINLGNTCYLNSILQALFHVPAFVNWLLNDSLHFSKCEMMNGMTHSECLICAMSKTLQMAQKSTGSSIKPLNIYSKLKAICKHLMHGHQEDAHEFLRYLIEGMERCYLTIFNGIKLDTYSKETTPLNQIFGGYIRTEVSCLVCHHISTTFQHFQDLLLDIRQATTVEDALETYFSKERLGDGDQAYKCEQCKRRVAATKKFTVERPPNVLCIQLKRFGTLGGKNNKPIILKQFLDLTKYRHRPSGYTYKYKLVALVSHLGNSSSCGHYTAVGLGTSGSYYLFDDTLVRPLCVATVLNSSAYILMYELERNRTQESHRLVRKDVPNGIHQNLTTQGEKVQNGNESRQYERKPFIKTIPIKPVIPLPNTVFNNKEAQKEKPIQQPSTSRDSHEEKTKLVPYLSGSSDSEDNESNSKFIGPLPQKESDLQNGHKKITFNDSDTNGWSDVKKEHKMSPVKVEVDRKWEVPTRSEQPSPAGSSSSGRWSVTSERDKTPDQNDKNDRREKPVEHLLKMNHRGYGQSVQSWNGSQTEIDAQVNDERNLKRPHSYDDELDRGKMKKIRKHHYSNGKDRKNKLQEYQNRKNNYRGGGGGNRQAYYRQYTMDRQRNYHNKHDRQL